MPPTAIHQIVPIRIRSDTGIPLLTVSADFFLRAWSLHTQPRPPNTVVTLHSVSPNHLQRREYTASTKVGLTIGLTFFILAAWIASCLFRHRRQDTRRRPRLAVSGNSRNSRRRSSRKNTHVFTYHESVTSTHNKRASRSRTRSQPCCEAERCSRSVEQPEIHLTTPEQVYQGASQGFNPMDAPQDFVACSQDHLSGNKVRNDRKKCKKERC
ncbi:hypothetical protein BGZ63DRAFT_433003 [Mariannaea sp. PMI_226]|nr:hypothetical protein BGZ63DRAFT_433003 [Mariannaea sp. PMI_226]